MYMVRPREIGGDYKKLCEMKQVQLIDGKICIDHVHMYVAIPPKMSVSEFAVARHKGKKHIDAI